MLAHKARRNVHWLARLWFDQVHELKHVHHTWIGVKVHIDTRPPSTACQAMPIIVQQFGRAYLDQQ
jgi:hypothetical protein